MADTVYSYRTIENTPEAEYTEKRSRFLAFATHVESDEDAREQIANFRKRFYDARHVCFAYIIGEGADYNRSQDDGEPSGTGGKPILGQIEKRELTFTLVVVVRYYGGTPLGAANLGRAYRTAAEAALEKAEIKEYTLTTKVVIECDYNDVNIVESAAKQFELDIIERNYLATAMQAVIAVPLATEKRFQTYISKFYMLKYKSLDNDNVDLI